MKLIKSIKSFLKINSEAFYPSDIKCVVCDAELCEDTRYMICDDCKLNFNTTFCNFCGRAINSIGDVCDECYNYNNSFSAARSSFVFGENVSKLIYKFKYRNARYLAHSMAQFMADTYYEADWNIDLVTFVPIHKKRRWQRGYNQSELIAKEFCKITELPLETLLDKIVYTKNMAKLTREERAKSIADTFCLKAEIGDIKGKNILLIDDVLTSGATSNECAKQLKLQASEVYVLTFASVKNKQRLIYNDDNKKIPKNYFKSHVKND